MYRINLYPEFEDHKRRARKGACWTAILAGVLSVELILVGVLALSGTLLSEQAAAIRSEISRIGVQGSGRAADAGELSLARQLLDLRLSRIDWSPKLASLSERIDSDLILDKVTGQVASKGQPAKLLIRGGVRSSSDPLRSASGFVETLRSDPRIATDFPKIRLGNIGGDEGGRMQIVCEAQGDSTQ